MVFYRIVINIKNQKKERNKMKYLSFIILTSFITLGATYEINMQLTDPAEIFFESPASDVVNCFINHFHEDGLHITSELIRPDGSGRYILREANGGRVGIIDFFAFSPKLTDVSLVNIPFNPKGRAFLNAAKEECEQYIPAWEDLSSVRIE